MPAQTSAALGVIPQGAWASWEAERRASVAAARARRPADLRRLAAARERLRPTIDTVLGLVLCDCPSCGCSGSLAVVPRRERVMESCEQCGVQDG